MATEWEGPQPNLMAGELDGGTRQGAEWPSNQCFRPLALSLYIYIYIYLSLPLYIYIYIPLSLLLFLHTHSHSQSHSVLSSQLSISLSLTNRRSLPLVTSCWAGAEV